ncbi:Argonaute siRNA chaperone complex subunit Arb1-domain-containing protein [Aspergillus sergii]|uniref:Argonaute siRNA chaperone complex subunit Arb1-domain-containing protein n=1 Tax=Aspergillus sergii TaxID=1034303 RepID=A0A5N6WM16_9EURO|nr:Argonaute siRNA chaperone complex subunit Arb1-domain-containing protein [Aspergillus sergii]
MASKDTGALLSLPLRLRQDVKDSYRSIVGSGEATLTAPDQATGNELEFARQTAAEAEAPTVADPMEIAENQANPSHKPLLDDGEATVTDPFENADGATASKPQAAVDGGKPSLSTPVQTADDQTDSISQPAVSDGDTTLTQPSQAADEQAKLANSVHSSVIDDGETIDMATVDLVAPKKKKKRKTKSKAKHGKGKPTGFEEYYVDVPITPKEYEEEKALYDIRIEAAILRYQNSRRIEPDRREVFMRYLTYGGVDVGPKMFTGVDEQELQQLDSEQALIAKGQASIRQECAKLPVDFNTVVKGYLTSYFPYFFNPETEDMVKLATVTIRNFLSYLLYHEVCPEYKENIDEARMSCDIATKELWLNQEFATSSPGDFNKACSTLFGGFFYDVNAEENGWNKRKNGNFLMKKDVARKVVKFAIAGSGTNAMALQFQTLANQNALHSTLVPDIHGFEVIAVFPPTPEVREFYRHHAPDLNPVGRMVGKAYRDPGKPRYDLSAEERLMWETGVASMPDFQFFLEENLLKLCYPKMKVITPVWELNCGLNFFEDVHTVYSSIYTVLCNDLMLGYKQSVDLTGKEPDDVEEIEEPNGDGAEKKETTL